MLSTLFKKKNMKTMKTSHTSKFYKKKKLLRIVVYSNIYISVVYLLMFVLMNILFVI